MGRWTQYEDSAHRLPEGFTRTGYDADTGRYTYEDNEGRQWRSEPGMEYGTLTPVPDFYETRAKMLAAAKANSTGPAPKSFHDILSSSQIATSPTSEAVNTPPKSPKSPRSKFISVARKATLPKMKGVVDSLLASRTNEGLQRIPSPEKSPKRSFFKSHDTPRRADVPTVGRSATTAAISRHHDKLQSPPVPRKDDIRRSRTVAEPRTSSSVERSHRSTFEEARDPSLTRSQTSARSRPSSPHSHSSRPSREEPILKSILTQKTTAEKSPRSRPRFEEPHQHTPSPRGVGFAVPAGTPSGMRRPKDDLRRGNQPVVV
ncbi:hypothetical protein VNI00_002576 [Paramarasmius palmivorus]|uniref:Uncharacterized protein n=1 Tax=Paramarasmius palmivorus TaxID=297713 RepID=A0AAW0DVC1_9AGAR